VQHLRQFRHICLRTDHHMNRQPTPPRILHTSQHQLRHQFQLTIQHTRQHPHQLSTATKVLTTATHTTVFAKKLATTTSAHAQRSIAVYNTAESRRLRKGVALAHQTQQFIQHFIRQLTLQLNLHHYQHHLPPYLPHQIPRQLRHLCLLIRLSRPQLQRSLQLMSRRVNPAVLRRTQSRQTHFATEIPNRVFAKKEAAALTNALARMATIAARTATPVQQCQKIAAKLPQTRQNHQHHTRLRLLLTRQTLQPIRRRIQHNIQLSIRRRTQRFTQLPIRRLNHLTNQLISQLDILPPIQPLCRPSHLARIKHFPESVISIMVGMHMPTKVSAFVVAKKVGIVFRVVIWMT
jgi:hypothetical protein